MDGSFKHIRLYVLFFICALLSLKSNGQEICNNGKDDDGDSLIDINDPDCQCHFIVNGNLLQNASFESYAHCPVSYLYSNESDIVNAWKFGTYININEAFYFHNLTCSYDSGRVMQYMPPATPLPNGTGFISIEKDAYSDLNVLEHDMSKGYVGQCLATPLRAGGDYTLSFYAGRFKSWDNFTGKIFPFKVAVFGNADCNAVPFGKVNVLGNGCPTNYPGWVFLGEVEVVSTGQWVQSKVHLNVPFDINVIEVGADCSITEPIIDLPDGTTFLDYHQYYLDDLHLLPTKDFPFEYIQTKVGSTCSDQPVLVAPVIAGASYQWYKDSVAIVGATAGNYQVLNNAGINYYNVKITTISKCSISEPYLVTPDMLNAVHIPTDTIFCTEDNVLRLAPALAGITYNINGVVDDSVTIKDAGTYTIIARNSTGCEKNFKTTIGKVNCTGCTTLIPSAFTPNGDGLNDVFRPKFNCAVSSVQFIIYNRWGQKIFESKDIHKGWNGLFDSNAMPTGTYVYTVQYKTINNISKNASGLVTLIR